MPLQEKCFSLSETFLVWRSFTYVCRYITFYFWFMSTRAAKTLYSKPHFKLPLQVFCFTNKPFHFGIKPFMSDRFLLLLENEAILCFIDFLFMKLFQIDARPSYWRQSLYPERSARHTKASSRLFHVSFTLSLERISKCKTSVRLSLLERWCSVIKGCRWR